MTIMLFLVCYVYIEYIVLYKYFITIHTIVFVCLTDLTTFYMMDIPYVE